METNQKHAVTGAFGFSGRYISERLLSKGHEVITLTNSPNRKSPLQGKIKAYPFNFDNLAALTQSLEGVDVVYNTYWVRFNHKRFNHADAVENTLTLFKAAKDAGVKRFVHVSISNASLNSPFEYFQGKAKLEQALENSGLSYAVLQPTVLFGDEDILINNIAWTLRKLPVFPCFGDGSYYIQPIHVDDLADIAVEQGESRTNGVFPAVGPEDFKYKDLVKMIGDEIGCKRAIVPFPPSLAYALSVAIGKIIGDVFITKDEIRSLMDNLLHIPTAERTGSIFLSKWVKENSARLGKHYSNELTRRIDKLKAY
ncbi:NAD(P)H-binding protein [Desulfovibrio litoralis]|uniref:NADH dehydrogenase n=1 Tax=Desulfovibrio litoralis DSM 11393 TaxID=1121455 RepID=A0A1M7TMB4_9BACT|nr:NAD(P)H-binding protein [Desulfovibrio litoralis]SHN71855.1 NADH dehydrogenase [Desulfovibrio litoralis DSM 11393]